MLPSIYLILIILVSFFQVANWVIVLRSFTLLVEEKPAVLDVYQLKFNSYLKDFNKHYGGEERERRFVNFKASLKEIARFNAIEGNTVFGLTKFSDMSKDEFAERMLLKPGTIPTCKPKQRSCILNHDQSATEHVHDQGYGHNPSSTTSDPEPPLSFDWRAKGKVAPVLNQKLCMACWAFSVAGVMESMAAIRKIDKLERRSIQELIDCSTYTNGCKGGHVKNILDFLCQRYNIWKVVREEDYSLTLVDDRKCRMPAHPNGIQLKNYTFSCNVNEDTMVSKIANHGPIIAAVDATNWMNYIGGVIRRACSRGNLNHVIQIVGYNIYSTSNSDSLPYYIIKNSYGEDFGEHGYVKVAYNEDVCGIAEEVTWIEVAKADS